jgi:hypothetical protein
MRGYLPPLSELLNADRDVTAPRVEVNQKLAEGVILQKLVQLLVVFQVPHVREGAVRVGVRDREDVGVGALYVRVGGELLELKPGQLGLELSGVAREERLSESGPGVLGIGLGCVKQVPECLEKPLNTVVLGKGLPRFGLDELIHGDILDARLHPLADGLDIGLQPGHLIGVVLVPLLLANDELAGLLDPLLQPVLLLVPLVVDLLLREIEDAVEGGLVLLGEALLLALVGHGVEGVELHVLEDLGHLGEVPAVLPLEELEHVRELGGALLGQVEVGKLRVDLSVDDLRGLARKAALGGSRVRLLRAGGSLCLGGLIRLGTHLLVRVVHWQKLFVIKDIQNGCLRLKLKAMFMNLKFPIYKK